MVFIFNAIQCMRRVGTVFHACCLLETTTYCFPIRTLPSAPTATNLMADSTLLLPQVVGLRCTVRRELSDHERTLVSDAAFRAQIPWVEILQSIRSSSNAAKTSTTGGQSVPMPSSTRIVYRS